MCYLIRPQNGIRSVHHSHSIQPRLMFRNQLHSPFHSPPLAKHVLSVWPCTVTAAVRVPTVFDQMSQSMTETLGNKVIKTPTLICQNERKSESSCSALSFSAALQLLIHKEIG